MEKLRKKLDKNYLEMIPIIKQEDCTKLSVVLSNSRSYYLDLIKLYGRSKDCGNQTSLVTSTSVGDKDPNETVIDTQKWSNRKPRGERRGLFRAFCYTRKQKATQYRQTRKFSKRNCKIRVFPRNLKSLNH